MVATFPVPPDPPGFTIVEMDIVSAGPVGVVSIGDGGHGGGSGFVL